MYDADFHRCAGFCYVLDCFGPLFTYPVPVAPARRNALDIDLRVDARPRMLDVFGMGRDANWCKLDLGACHLFQQLTLVNVFVVKIFGDFFFGVNVSTSNI